MAQSIIVPIRVMLVDDHRTVLWGLEKLIDSEKPRMEVVGTATNCTEAIELANKTSPSVILLDIDLGKESGIDAIPAFVARTGIRVLVLTGVRDVSLHDRAVLAGAKGIIHKEEPPEMILRAIRKVHEGELWLDRVILGRLFGELLRTGAAPRPNAEELQWAQLTVRERQIIIQVSANPSANTGKIAERLHISEHTVRNHLTSIYSKLHVVNRLELFVYARRHAGRISCVGDSPVVVSQSVTPRRS
jgi:two-component system nitrate/nitrite response regulator NarL